jgi:hypothetical protein
VGGDVAHVGSASIPPSLVGQVAAARRTSASEALDALVEDALLAEGAHALALDRSAPARWDAEVAVARVLTERLRDDATRQGPPTPDEVATLTVVHAVARTSAAGATAADARALAVARTIASAVAGAKNDEEFLSRAKGVPHGDVSVVAERLAPFDATGTTGDGASYDPAFVAGAFSLHVPGETSGVVPTSYGWHVIRLVERRPSASAVDSPAEGLPMPVQLLRARTGMARALASARARSDVDVATAADELMSLAAASVP